MKDRLPFNRVTFSDGKGAKLADSHHNKTGHTIKTSGKKRLFNKGFDFFIKYTCRNCDFKSDGFTRYEIL